MSNQARAISYDSAPQGIAMDNPRIRITSYGSRYGSRPEGNVSGPVEIPDGKKLGDKVGDNRP